MHMHPKLRPRTRAEKAISGSGDIEQPAKLTFDQLCLVFFSSGRPDPVWQIKYDPHSYSFDKNYSIVTVTLKSYKTRRYVGGFLRLDMDVDIHQYTHILYPLV
jgi:hypothetical protein